MRLEIGAGAAAGRAGGVLWSSAILAAISPRGAAFTSPLPAPARSAEPAASARLRLRGPAACGPAARTARSSSEPLLAPSSIAGLLSVCPSRQGACWLHSPLTWTPFGPSYPGLSLGHGFHTACGSLCLSFPLSSLLCPLPQPFPFPLEVCLLTPE